MEVIKLSAQRKKSLSIFIGTTLIIYFVFYALLAIKYFGGRTDLGDQLAYVNKATLENITEWPWVDRLNYAIFLGALKNLGVKNEVIGPVASWMIFAAIMAFWILFAYKKAGYLIGLLYLPMFLCNPFVLAFTSMGYPSALETLSATSFILLASSKLADGKKAFFLGILCSISLFSKGPMIILILCFLIILTFNNHFKIFGLFQIKPLLVGFITGFFIVILAFFTVYDIKSLFKILSFASTTNIGGMLEIVKSNSPNFKQLFLNPLFGSYLVLSFLMIFCSTTKVGKLSGLIGFSYFLFLILFSFFVRSTTFLVANYYTLPGIIIPCAFIFDSYKTNKISKTTIKLLLGILITFTCCIFVFLEEIIKPQQWVLIENTSLSLSLLLLICCYYFQQNNLFLIKNNFKCSEVLLNISFAAVALFVGIKSTFIGLNHATWYKNQNRIQHLRAIQLIDQAEEKNNYFCIEDWQWISSASSSWEKVANRENERVAWLANFYAADLKCSKKIFWNNFFENSQIDTDNKNFITDIPRDTTSYKKIELLSFSTKKKGTTQETGIVFNNSSRLINSNIIILNPPLANGLNKITIFDGNKNEIAFRQINIPQKVFEQKNKDIKFMYVFKNPFNSDFIEIGITSEEYKNISEHLDIEMLAK